MSMYRNLARCQCVYSMDFPRPPAHPAMRPSRTSARSPEFAVNCRGLSLRAITVRRSASPGVSRFTACWHMTCSQNESETIRLNIERGRRRSVRITAQKPARLLHVSTESTSSESRAVICPIVCWGESPLQSSYTERP